MASRTAVSISSSLPSVFRQFLINIINWSTNGEMAVTWL